MNLSSLSTRNLIRLLKVVRATKQQDSRIGVAARLEAFDRLLAAYDRLLETL